MGRQGPVRSRSATDHIALYRNLGCLSVGLHGARNLRIYYASDAALLLVLLLRITAAYMLYADWV